MKKVYLLITAICLAALTGCIKEDVDLTQANVSMSISTRAELSSSSEQGDAIGDINVWAFACDAQGNVSESGQTAVAWRRISAANTHTSVDVHLQFATCDDDADHYYKLVAVINEGEFGTVSGITSFDRNTTYSQLANAAFVATDLMAKTPGNGPNSTPGQMPISHWTIITLNKSNNGSTHPDNCVEVSMPVYRAVAKTQLFVAKTDASTPLVIKNVTIGSSAFPTQGALLSAAKGTTNTDNTAGDFDGDGATTPMWYINSVTASNNKTENIFSSTEGQSITKVLSKDAHASAKMDAFDYVTSHFLYENKGGSNTWDTESTNGGYYMDVTYDITPDTANDDKTERVWLPAVVRNHDYQVRALVDARGKLELTLQVVDWRDVEQNWDYTDVATLADNGVLTWDSTSTIVGDRVTAWKKDNNGDETEEVDYYFKNVTVTNTSSAICTFHIDTPTGATWQAMFANGDVNSFEFVNENNNSLGQTTSGNVGEQATLRIRATKPANGYTRDQKVFLDIVVKTADGRIIKVNQLMVDGDTQIKYQLVQNI